MTHLTQERLRILVNYCEQTGVFRWSESAHKPLIGKIAGNPNSNGYIKFSIGGRTYMAHRLAWLYVYGKWPTNTIDHMDGDRTNNRISNLRDVTQLVNRQNVRRTVSGKDSPLGVTLHKKSQRWQAQIRVHGKSVYLGLFDCKNEAHNAYLAAKRAFHDGCLI